MIKLTFKRMNVYQKLNAAISNCSVGANSAKQKQGPFLHYVCLFSFQFLECFVAGE